MHFLFPTISEISYRPSQSFSGSSFEYSMNHQRRGKCIIFINKRFDMVEKCFKKMNDHPENENDVRSLESCFGGLGFEVFIHEDLKKAEIKLVLEACK